MSETKVIAIALLAVIMGVAIAYLPMIVFQTQFATQMMEQGAGPDAMKNETNATYNAYAGDTLTNDSILIQDNTRAMAAGLVSSSGGLVAGIAIGLAVAVVCYFVIKRKTIDQKMLNIASQ